MTKTTLPRKACRKARRVNPRSKGRNMAALSANKFYPVCIQLTGQEFAAMKNTAALLNLSHGRLIGRLVLEAELQELAK